MERKLFKCYILNSHSEEIYEEGIVFAYDEEDARSKIDKGDYIPDYNEDQWYDYVKVILNEVGSFEQDD